MTEYHPKKKRVVDGVRPNSSKNREENNSKGRMRNQWFLAYFCMPFGHMSELTKVPYLI